MKVFQMLYNPDTDRFTLDGKELECGDCLRVLVFNGLSNSPEWIDTRLEMDGEGNYYLVGLMGYSISGLFAERA